MNGTQIEEYQTVSIYFISYIANVISEMLFFPFISVKEAILDLLLDFW